MAELLSGIPDRSKMLGMSEDRGLSRFAFVYFVYLAVDATKASIDE